MPKTCVHPVQNQWLKLAQLPVFLHSAVTRFDNLFTNVLVVPDLYKFYPSSYTQAVMVFNSYDKLLIPTMHRPNNNDN